VKEAIKAAALDLAISRNLGFAYVIPYKERGKPVPQFQMGYKGYIQLAIRTGQYKHLNTGAVYEGETVVADKIKGTLEITGEPIGEAVIGFFAYMELINGFQKAIFWTAEKMRNHAKKYSKGYASYLNGRTKFKPIWETDFEGMGKKTMILQLVPKYGPMSIEMSQAMASDKADFKGFDNDDQTQAEIDQNANQEYIDITPGNSPSNDVGKPETPPKDEPGPDGLTDEEKAEIEAQERAEAVYEAQKAAQVDGPDF
jgi:recombination protein RecT